MLEAMLYILEYENKKHTPVEWKQTLMFYIRLSD